MCGIIGYLRKPGCDDDRPIGMVVLEMLSAIGLVQQTRLGDGVAHFEVVDHPDRHHHLVCASCGKVQNVPAEVLGEIAVRLAEHHGFHIGTVDLMIRGECSACRGRAG